MVKLVAGLMGSSVATGSTKMSPPDQLRPFLAMLQNHNVTELDTARVYHSGTRAKKILEPSQKPKISSKSLLKRPGFSPGSLATDKVIANCNASLAALNQDRIELYYFHGPDRQTPLKESCKAINQLHQDGKIARFGVSNFNRGEVEEMHSICTANGWLRPSVYQGGFNPLSRAAEEKLFPTLRKLGMAFYAFSPLAGGYFSRSTDQLREPPAGGGGRTRWCISRTCITLKAATLRFLAHHSALGVEDGIILGASSQEQMEENLEACEAGKLPASVVAAFDTLWARYKGHGYSEMYCV